MMQTIAAKEFTEKCLKDNFFSAIEPISELPSDQYFIYGSTAQSIRSGQILNRSKQRFLDIPPLSDIDLALFEDYFQWSEIMHLSQQVYDNSKSTFCLDPHFIKTDPENSSNSIIRGASLPKTWLLPIQYSFEGITLSLIDPTTSIMLRMLHADPRIRDTQIIIREMQILGNWRDERLKFGISHLLNTPGFYKKAPLALTKLLLGLLPENTQEKLRLSWRNQKVDAHLGSSVIRYQAEHL
jgi:hypothetical protein